ncbi:hypothetical protein Cflav_PD2271 [Pedosphaera parvula Ellin514]|uniref:Uncharacterized protein n=1 Tax=Pedosphaera parvula (strain Ellin514) TaxID=320771 RepID=B9XL76_PEDPL|nr:hypothetical protein Cflav_PD2271 [Pedosphaera parvula Ellin514]
MHPILIRNYAVTSTIEITEWIPAKYEYPKSVHRLNWNDLPFLNEEEVVKCN